MGPGSRGGTTGFLLFVDRGFVDTWDSSAEIPFVFGPAVAGGNGGGNYALRFFFGFFSSNDQSVCSQ